MPHTVRPQTSPIKTAAIRFDDVGGGMILARDARQQDAHMKKFRRHQMLAKDLRPGNRQSVFVSGTSRAHMSSFVCFSARLYILGMCAWQGNFPERSTGDKKNALLIPVVGSGNRAQTAPSDPKNGQRFLSAANKSFQRLHSRKLHKNASVGESSSGRMSPRALALQARSSGEMVPSKHAPSVSHRSLASSCPILFYKICSDRQLIFLFRGVIQERNPSTVDETRHYWLTQGKYRVNPERLREPELRTQRVGPRPLGSNRKPVVPRIGVHRQRRVEPTIFRIYYERGDLPISVDHTLGGQRIKWQTNLTELDYKAYFPVFCDGLRELDEPYRFLAIQGTVDLIEMCPHKLVTCIPHVSKRGILIECRGVPCCRFSDRNAATSLPSTDYYTPQNCLRYARADHRGACPQDNAADDA